MPAQLRFQLLSSDPVTGDTTGAYYVQIVDSGGNLINGNGVIVQYKQVANGVPQATQSVSVPGQQVKIYNGVIHNSSFDISYFLIDSSPPIPDDDTPSQPGAPDLQLQSIETVQKADSAGNNAIIKVNATSSNLPITYLIDDDLENTTGNFTGITAGLHHLKITDTTDTEIEQDFFVEKLDSILTSSPEVVQDGYYSRWNAAFNPIVFTYQRRDMQVINIDQDDTTLKPKITVNTDISGIAVGEYVYVAAGLTEAGEITYIGTYQVLSKISNNILIIDTDFIASDTITGFVNSNTLRPYYKINTLIKFVSPDTGRFETITSTNRPDKSGLTKADISSLLQSVLKPAPDQSDYTEINYRDMGLAISYQISYAEVWVGNTPAYTEIADPFYAVFAAKQLGQNGGGNLIDFVPQAGGVKLAKWIVDFEHPNYSNGYPFDLGFIYSEKIAGRDIKVKITALDINKQPLTDGEYTSFLLNEDGSFLLNQDGSKFIIARQSLVNTPIVEHVGLNRLLINQDFGPMCYYLQVQLYYQSTSEADLSISVTEYNVSGDIDVDPQRITASAEIAFTNEDEETFTVASLSANGYADCQISDNQKYTITAMVGSIIGDIPNPKLRLTVYKDDVVIFDRQDVAAEGSGLYKEGNATPGSVYHALITTLNTTTPVTPINIDDFGAAPEVTNNNVTEQILVRYDRKCVNNDVYLRWIGLNGSWNYYKFRFSQDIVLDVQNANIVTQYVTDWQNSETIEQVISKSAAKKITVYADELDINDIHGLQGLKYSPKVQILVSKSPIKWQTILLNTSSFTEYNTQVGRSDNFSVTFNMPSINIQNL